MIGDHPKNALRAQLKDLADKGSLNTPATGLLDKEYLNAFWQEICALVRQHQVVITAVKAEGASEKNQHEECVVIENTGPVIADLSGWRLNAGADQDFVFPDNTYLAPEEKLAVWTFDQDKPYSFNSHRPVWNNRGDTALLWNKDEKQISALCYGSAAAPFVTITEIQFDGIEGRGEADEYVEITNHGDIPAEISDWTISAGKNQDFTFPDNTVLEPGGAIKVFTNKVVPESGGFSFNSKTAIWNNKEDIGRLYDYRQQLVSELHYKDGVAL